jgi:hypothetical protein
LKQNQLFLWLEHNLVWLVKMNHESGTLTVE